MLQTHAHIDHSGLLPRLCALGLLGPIITTTATADLLSVMRLDSAFIQEGDWARAQRNRGQRPARSRAGASAPLLFTAAQAEACLEQPQGVAYDMGLQPHASVRCRFRDAGRIKRHLRYHLGRAECAIVIIGDQAAGTLGRRLVDGEKRVRIFDEAIAARVGIHTIGGLSAHADQAALLSWLGSFTMAPVHTFVVHGETRTACRFGDLVADRLGWNVGAPARGTRGDL